MKIEKINIKEIYNEIVVHSLNITNANFKLVSKEFIQINEHGMVEMECAVRREDGKCFIFNCWTSRDKEYILPAEAEQCNVIPLKTLKYQRI